MNEYGSFQILTASAGTVLIRSAAAVRLSSPLTTGRFSTCRITADLVSVRRIVTLRCSLGVVLDG